MSRCPGGGCVCCFALTGLPEGCLGALLGPFFCASSKRQGLGGQEGLETVLTLHLYAVSVLSISATVNYL